MDAIELARQLAAQLHSDAVTRGLNPWRAYEFAVGEAAHHGYEVEHSRPGAAMLDGGRAKLLPSEELILHEKKGTLFEQALLVAHEIGHAKLGDAEDETPANGIDFARSSEPSPVGEERVVDYGRRQRREIQMDLFAREFLIPRTVVRRLHVEDGFTATDIASRLEAPFDVVAQQLFDALLLPPILPVAGEEQSELPLNTSQNEAAAHRGVAYLLEAGPGTGKTQTLVARVAGLLDQGVDPRRILLLTFSNKAAGEMAERIARKCPVPAASLWVGTFHAFGLDLVRRFHAELGLPKDPRMIERTEAMELLEDEFPKLGLTHYLNLYDPTQVISDLLGAISRAKDEVVGPEEYAQFGQEMLNKAESPDERVAAERVVEVARVYAAYETLKRERNCVDFGDLVWLPVKLLESNPAIKEHFAGLYDHVLVDEYQDVNRSSVRLLTLLRGEGENLWVVGDAKQSIYRFRGASSFNVTRFGNQDFPSGIKGWLKINYRSLKPIVDGYSKFAESMRVGGQQSALETNRDKPGELPELLIADDADMQTVALADTIESMIAAGYRYRDQAVLCTGNDKLSELGLELERLGVPVLFLGSLFERPEVKDLLSLVSILTDARAMGLVRTACTPQFEMSLSDVSSVLSYLRENQSLPTAFLDTPDSIPGLSMQGITALEQLRYTLGGFNTASRPWEIFATVLLDRTRMAADISSANTISARAQGIAIWQFLNFVRTQPADQGLPIVRLMDRTRRLLRLGDDRDLRQLPAAAQGVDAVRLMTIHGAKGLEFNVVHVPGLNQDTLPGHRRPLPACPPPDGMTQGATGSIVNILQTARDEEQECLFYVAQSRARDRLFLYAADKNRGGRARKLSDFLDRIGSGLRRRHVTPQRDLPPALTSANISMSIPGGLNLDAHHIELYTRCPRRFFYTHVLQTGGRRKTTTFMQMHQAVRTVLKKVVAGGVSTVSGDLEANVADALDAEGLGEHGYYEQYNEFALALIRFFAASREGYIPEEPTTLRVAFGDEEIIVLPDDVLIGRDGRRTVRRVMTGYGRKDEEKSIGAAAFLLAAEAAFPGTKVELLHLADRQARHVSLKPDELKTREQKLRAYLAEIRAGSFPQETSSRTCPGCPALFICGPVPAGTFQPVFRAPFTVPSS